MQVPSPDLSTGALSLSRRNFLQACSILAMTAAGCQATGPRTRFAAHMLADPPEREYRPILGGIIRALLPFEHPRFPAIAPETVEARLLDLFPIDTGEQFLSFQRGLLFFDDVTLFPYIFGPLVDAEQVGTANGDSQVGEIERGERARYAVFESLLQARPSRFTPLDPDAQRAYLRMWSVSGVAAKRQFARSAKSLVMVTVYSMEEMWRTIDYEGPLLETPRATT